ncbi:hypothetical protein GWI33_001752 [Rhynchophorus ferrugineus]|uniref:Uncharacterized protein n=1 Tax=Rhynchophorus ferrugineus TaxID=354439 RepID=A0A834IZ04_RHYFE|nr:hypothetical protein GWI33_001752 [Rhynchophorus ferrugineus]
MQEKRPEPEKSTGRQKKTRANGRQSNQRRNNNKTAINPALGPDLNNVFDRKSRSYFVDRSTGGREREREGKFAGGAAEEEGTPAGQKLEVGKRIFPTSIPKHRDMEWKDIVN